MAVFVSSRGVSGEAETLELTLMVYPVDAAAGRARHAADLPGSGPVLPGRLRAKTAAHKFITVLSTSYHIAAELAPILIRPTQVLLRQRMCFA